MVLIAAESAESLDWADKRMMPTARTPASSLSRWSGESSAGSVDGRIFALLRGTFRYPLVGKHGFRDCDRDEIEQVLLAKLAKRLHIRTAIPKVHFEVKRAETFRLYSALEQATDDAGENIPVVLHKQNRKPWVAVVRLDDLPNLATQVYLTLVANS